MEFTGVILGLGGPGEKCQIEGVLGRRMPPWNILHIPELPVESAAAIVVSCFHVFGLVVVDEGLLAGFTEVQIAGAFDLENAHLLPPFVLVCDPRRGLSPGCFRLPVPVRIVGSGPGLGSLLPEIMEKAAAHVLAHNEREGLFQRFHTIIDHSYDYIWQVDADGRYTFVNKSFEESLGHRAQDLMGRERDSFIPDIPDAATRLILDEFRSGAKHVVRKYPYKSRSGKMVHVESQIVPVHDAQGGLSGFFGIGRDVSEWVNALEKLHVQKKVLECTDRASRLILSNRSFSDISADLLETAKEFTRSHCGMVIYLDAMLNSYQVTRSRDSQHAPLESKTYPVAETPAWLEHLFGYETPKVLLSFPDSLESDFPFLDGAGEILVAPCYVGGEPQGFIVLCARPDRPPFHSRDLHLLEELCRYYAQAIRYENLQQKLKSSLNLFQRFQDANLVGMYRLSFSAPVSTRGTADEVARAVLERGRYEYANDAFARMYGLLKGEEIVGKKPGQFTVSKEDALRRTRDFVERHFQVGQAVFHDRDALGNGKVFNNTSYGYVEKGYLVLVWGIQVDITIQKRLEEEYGKLHKAIEQASDGVVIANSQDRIEYINPAFSKMSGYHMSEVLGKPMNFLGTPQHDTDQYDRMTSRIRAGKTFSGTLVSRKKSGVRFTEEVTATPVKDESGTVTHTITIRRDITRESEMERQILHSCKMEAVGTLSGGIAHDFNNILSGILGFTSLLKVDLPQGSGAQEYVRDIETLALKAADLSSRLLGFARKDEPHRFPLNLNESVKNVVKLIQHTFRKDIRVDVDLSHDLVGIEGDAGQIEGALMNICINARDAMPEGGILTISTTNVRADQDGESVLLGVPDGDYACVSIHDTGIGMPSEIQQRIFDPFFTTKKETGGSGLGLSMVYSSVKAHGGVVTLNSAPSEGTEFLLYFPKSGGTVQTPAREEATMEFEGASERILLVDDDDMVRNTGRRLLEQMGYLVVTAENGRVAMDKIQADPLAFDLVVLDMIMPEMNGEKTFLSVREVRGDIPILLASGYSSDQKTHTLLRMGRAGFIQKPFLVQEFGAAIRRLLGQPAHTKP